MPASKIYRASDIKVLSLGDEFCLNVTAKDGSELLIHFNDAEQLMQRINQAQCVNQAMSSHLPVLYEICKGFVEVKG